MRACKLWPIFAIALLLMGWSIAGAAAAGYPERPITAIVPFAPGSAVEIVARVISAPLSRALGQPIVIMSKPGGEGMLGTGQLAAAKPDGYTILFTAGSATLGPALRRFLPFDPVTQIKPVAGIGRSPYVVAASSKLGVTTFGDLIKRARDNPHKLNAASAGNSTRLAAMLLGDQAGVQFEIVAFDGTAQAMTSLASGETDFAIMDRLIFEPMVAAGRVKLLAAVSPNRLPDLPNIPTTAEMGLPDFSAGSLFGVYTVGGTPPDIVDRLNREVNKIIEDPDAIKALKSTGLEALEKGLSVEEFGQIYQTDLKRWKELVVRDHIPTID